MNSKVQQARNELIAYLKPITICENENCQNPFSRIKHFHEIFATRKTIMRIKNPLIEAWVYLFLPNVAVLCEECHLYKLPSREYFYSIKKDKKILDFDILLQYCPTYAKFIKDIPDLHPNNGINKLFDVFDSFKQQGLIKTTLSRPKNFMDAQRF